MLGTINKVFFRNREIFVLSMIKNKSMQQAYKEFLSIKDFLGNMMFVLGISKTQIIFIL